MKKMLPLFALLAISSTVFAADEMNPKFNCHRVPVIPDAGMGVTVLEGGIFFHTAVKVQNFFLGHSTSDNYLVRDIPSADGVAYEDSATQGQELSLNINQEARLKDGGYPAQLRLKNQKVSLSCTDAN